MKGKELLSMVLTSLFMPRHFWPCSAQVKLLVTRHHICVGEKEIERKKERESERPKNKMSRVVKGHKKGIVLLLLLLLPACQRLLLTLNESLLSFFQTLSFSLFLVSLVREKKGTINLAVGSATGLGGFFSGL